MGYSEGDLAVVGHQADGLNALHRVHGPNQRLSLSSAQLQHQKARGYCHRQDYSNLRRSC